MENRDTKDITLNEEKLLAERADDAKWRLNAENTRREGKGLPLLTDTSELDVDIESETVAAGQNPDTRGENGPLLVVNEKIEEESDPYLIEGRKILLDLINLQAEV